MAEKTGIGGESCQPNPGGAGLYGIVVMRAAAAVENESEAELVQRARNGDRDAFCGLVRVYDRRLFALANSLCADVGEAEDLSQEVWMRAYRALGEFRGDGGFYSWLRRIMLHAFLNSRRASAMERRSLAILPDGFEPSHPEAERKEMDRVLAQHALRSLQMLSSQERMAVVLKHMEGMTYDEIGHTLACSAGTIKKTVFRAIQKLRGHLNAMPGSEEEG